MPEFVGAPCYEGSIQKIVDKACRETEMYLRHKIDGIIVENMHDIPYVHSKHFQPEVAVVMTRVCTEIRKIIPDTIPCGVQVTVYKIYSRDHDPNRPRRILTAGNKEAVAVAQACSFNFIRSEGFVFGHIGDEGFINADAGILLRYRKYIGAENVLIFTDIKKKHSSHAITDDVSLVETAKAAEYFLSDGIILTGVSTGEPADKQELHGLKSNCNLPILIGSGVTRENVHEYYTEADALIIGSHFKYKGFWKNDVSEEHVRLFMNVVKERKESMA